MQKQEKPDIVGTALSHSGCPEETEPFEGQENTPSIAESEVIDRSIQLAPQFFRRDADGKIRVSASAFNDRYYEPSFYRESLCDNPPYTKPPRMNPNDAVATVTVGEVRQQDAITFQSGNDSRPITHNVDVRVEIDGHHKSHVVVFAAPVFKTKGGFARLKELLAQIVGDNWAIWPDDEFIKENLGQIPIR